MRVTSSRSASSAGQVLQKGALQHHQACSWAEGPRAGLFRGLEGLTDDVAIKPAEVDRGPSRIDPLPHHAIHSRGADGVGVAL